MRSDEHMLLQNQHMQGKGLIFRSIPGSRTWRMELTAKGEPDFSAPNQLLFARGMEAELGKSAETYWHPQPDVALPARPAWIVNTCADADEFSRAIQLLDETYPAGTPVFNHPRAVMAARRDIAGLILKDIPGLEVPRSKRVFAEGPQSFSDSFSESAFRFPVTLQRTTARNGVGCMVIADPGALEAALLLGGGAGLWHVMEQSNAVATGPCSGLRIVFVGRTGSVVAMREAAPEEAGAQPPLPSKELLQSVMRAAIPRMPLDFWTMDVTVLRPDRLRLVSVSAGLPVPIRLECLPMIRQQAIQLMNQLGPRLLSLLRDPGRWRNEAQALPSVAAYKELHGP